MALDLITPILLLFMFVSTYFRLPDPRTLTYLLWLSFLLTLLVSMPSFVRSSTSMPWLESFKIDMTQALVRITSINLHVLNVLSVSLTVLNKTSRVGFLEFSNLESLRTCCTIALMTTPQYSRSSRLVDLRYLLLD